MFKIGPRIRETTTTTGTSTLSLAGATTGMQTFVAGVGTTNTTRYCLVAANGTDWEVGTGTVTSGSPDTLTRDAVLASTNGGSAINLAAGTHRVFCTLGPFGGLGLWGAAMSAAVPTSTNTSLTTWRNQGGASVADVATGLALTGPNNASQNIRCRELAVSNQNSFIRTCLISGTFNQTDAQFWFGIGYNDGTKLLLFGILHLLASSAIAPMLGVTRYTNVTTGSTNDFVSSHPVPPMLWLQTELDATNAYFRISMDGISFTEVKSFAKTGSHLGTSGYTNFMFAIDPIGSNGTATLMSFG